MGFDLRVKQMFFDRAAVTKALSKAERKVFVRFGAFVRRTARSSIRPRRRMSLGSMDPEQRANYQRRRKRARRAGKPLPKRPYESSKPGEPPRSVTGVLKRGIFFSYEPDRRSVVIGAAQVSGKTTPGGKTVPQLLEEGGLVSKRGETLTYKPRPFMEPALEKEAPKLPGMWRDAMGRV